MGRNRLESAEYRRIANELGVPVTEVRRAVQSFFGIIVKEARSLPLDNERKIFTKDKFKEYECVHNIPSVGRLGPIYSRYLKWRSNEAKVIGQENRSAYRSRRTQDDIEHMAEEILSGRTPSITKRKNSEMFERVWLVGQDGKRSARQVIPKKVEDNNV